VYLVGEFCYSAPGRFGSAGKGKEINRKSFYDFKKLQTYLKEAKR